LLARNKHFPNVCWVDEFHTDSLPGDRNLTILKYTQVSSLENRRDLAVIVIEYGSDSSSPDLVEDPCRTLLVSVHKGKVGWRLGPLGEAAQRIEKILILEGESYEYRCIVAQVAIEYLKRPTSWTIRPLIGLSVQDQGLGRFDARGFRLTALGDTLLCLAERKISVDMIDGKIVSTQI